MKHVPHSTQEFTKQTKIIITTLTLEEKADTIDKFNSLINSRTYQEVLTHFKNMTWKIKPYVKKLASNL